jgi:hypothetical protein
VVEGYQFSIIGGVCDNSMTMGETMQPLPYRRKEQGPEAKTDRGS